MSKYALAGPSDGLTESGLTTLFQANSLAQLYIREERCCKDWIPVGSIRLHPGPEDKSEHATAIQHAVRLGAYEWFFPKHEELLKEVHVALGNPTGKAGKAGATPEPPILRRIIDHLAFVAVRTGLILPRIDADLLSSLPFQRPATLVVDTSAIIQGGLDFAVRFLCPTARIRVPAVAHMELLSQTDNYFKLRRAPSPTPEQAARALFERACGVGGQRVLLRVELHTDAEIERATTGADPLRGIVRLDEEHKALQVEHIQRSFADRLMFETAREHQARCSPGHRVMLMTCDEGLARMTLGDGMEPFLFRPPTPLELSGSHLPGTPFRPFSGELYPVRLTDLLWELAVTFGAARLVSDGVNFEIRATGADLSWRPFHATPDLLWISIENPRSTPQQAAQQVSPPVPARTSAIAAPSGASHSKLASYRFSPSRMLKLIQALAVKRRISFSEGQKLLSAAIDDYRGFLVAGRFCKISDKSLEADENLDPLWAALLSGDTDTLGHLWMEVPSFAAFINVLKERLKIKVGDTLPISERSVATYNSLAEVATLALSIPGEGIFWTGSRYATQEFAKKCFETYKQLARGDEYILTGAWLEAMARDHSVHPVRVRSQLEEARLAQYLERFTEGSTPETRFEQHAFSMLNRRSGEPTIERVYLYHGDFLIAGRASVSIRLQPKELP